MPKDGFICPANVLNLWIQLLGCATLNFSTLDYNHCPVDFSMIQFTHLQNKNHCSLNCLIFFY